MDFPKLGPEITKTKVLLHDHVKHITLYCALRGYYVSLDHCLYLHSNNCNHFNDCEKGGQLKRFLLDNLLEELVPPELITLNTKE